MHARRQPQPGDLYAACDDAGRWSLVLRFQAFEDAARGLATLTDDSGAVYAIPIDRLTPLRTVDPSADVDPAARLDDRLYRNRSRITAPQRARRKLTDTQRRTIFALARNRGLDIDDVRGMTPQRSISKLTVHEAGQLIERLKGKAVGT
jgi:hypothetical protein